MYENQMILTRGFQNVYKDGQPIGFQIQIKTAYYRGIFLGIIGCRIAQTFARVHTGRDHGHKVCYQPGGDLRERGNS